MTTEDRIFREELTIDFNRLILGTSLNAVIRDEAIRQIHMARERLRRLDIITRHEELDYE